MYSRNILKQILQDVSDNEAFANEEAEGDVGLGSYKFLKFRIILKYFRIQKLIVLQFRRGLFGWNSNL